MTDSLKQDILYYKQIRQTPQKRSKRAPLVPKDDQGYIFACHSDPHYGQHLSSTSIHNVVKQFTDEFEAEFGHSFSLHSFRHGFATEAIKAGTQLALLKELLGHSDIATTMRYVHLNNADLYKAWSNIPKI
ncbi:MAG: site-specific integrase [bacterium]|nr:site-specific integrase [bacterium]